MINKPIVYDFHGDKPLSTPFTDIKPQDIHIYLDVDTYIGSKTCGQACKHCWFVNYEHVKKLKFKDNEGINITRFLKSEGYKVYPRYTDSFAYDGELMRHYGVARARTYFEGDTSSGVAMESGEAWTSGRPLLGEKSEFLLDTARDYGYGTITLTFHGLINEKGIISDRHEYPIKGVFYGTDLERVLKIIKDYNEKNRDIFTGFRIGIGITVGSHNVSKEMLERYLDYFNKIGIDTLRFNKFFDHGEKHPHLEITHQMCADFYKNIKYFHENKLLNFQLGVSEDFGSFGIDVLGLPPAVGHCQAGKQLFAIIPLKNKKSREKHTDYFYEEIGDIVGCVNIFEPKVGNLTRVTNVHNETITYKVNFYLDEINDLVNKRLNGVLKNGCFSRELMNNLSSRSIEIKNV
ncbi:radical SAM protein [Photorhabdus sp. RW14-46]|uniref:radical SAM protein n=1 Tax=Photorhabdus sp. RW14-46 TaxID=2100168 RepID=UPI0013F3BCCC|nr:radical SAM protein [Photorhabdus sp. RW14-46]NHB60015.1 radical SAM protein [Photorhabdus sp. RW14-46]